MVYLSEDDVPGPATGGRRRRRGLRLPAGRVPTTDPACILQIADYSAPFASNFLSSLFRLEGLVRDRLGLRTVYVLPEAARERPWIRTAQDAGAIVEFLERGGSHRQRIRTLRCLGLEHRAALLHTHFGTFDADAAVAAWRLGRPVVWHMHSPFLTAGSWRRGVGEPVKFGLRARLLVGRLGGASPPRGAGAGAALIEPLLAEPEHDHPLRPLELGPEAPLREAACLLQLVGRHRLGRDLPQLAGDRRDGARCRLPARTDPRWLNA